jgi:hypothetical protein
MTLKTGKQKTYFYDTLNQYYPDLISQYEQIYTDNKWGNATHSYYHSLNQTYNAIMKQNRIAKRIPSELFTDVVTENDRVSIILDQLNYLMQLEGKKSPYGYAAFRISQLTQDLSNMKHHLQDIKGVGTVTEKIILEILDTQTSSYYEQLLRG